MPFLRLVVEPIEFGDAFVPPIVAVLERQKDDDGRSAPDDRA